MTVINQNSISGITSITAASGSVQIFNSDGSSGSLTDLAGINVAGVVTATSYSGTSDTIKFETGGSERLRINSSGNYKLITGSGGTLTFGIANGVGTQIQRLLYDDSDGSLTIGGGTATGYPLKFFTGNDERLRISSNGNVGIGTDNPGYKLDVRPTPSDPTSGSPPTGAFVQIRGDDATVGSGPNLVLSNFGGSKETAWRISAVSTSGNNGDLVFNGYAGGATYPEITRFLAGGGLTFNGDTAAANALDDYEEGTFTPYYSSNSATSPYVSDIVSSYNLRNGRYTKVGRKVFIELYIQCGASISYQNGGADGQILGIVGLPFTCNSAQTYPSISVGYYAVWNSWSSGYTPMGYVNNGSSYIQLTYANGSGTTNMLTTYPVRSNAAILLAGSYTIA